MTAAFELRKKGFDMPILFVSAYVNTLMREGARQVQAEIVEKPLDFITMFDHLESVILNGSPKYRYLSKSHSFPENITNERLVVPNIILSNIREVRKSYGK